MLQIATSDNIHSDTISIPFYWTERRYVLSSAMTSFLHSRDAFAFCQEIVSAISSSELGAMKPGTFTIKSGTGQMREFGHGVSSQMLVDNLSQAVRKGIMWCRDDPSKP